MNNYDLGRAIAQAGDLIWEKNGRALTDWERRMRTARTDVWIPAFGDVYRLHLTPMAMREVEQPTGLARIHATVLAGVDSYITNPASSTQVSAVVRLGLIGGGLAVVNGQQQSVTADDVRALMERLADMPLAETWRLARAVLDAVIMGRPATAEEQAVFAVPAARPIAPQWAMGYQV